MKEINKAININDKQIPFTDLILDGIKTIETRQSNSLKSLIGQRIGIIRTGCGKAMLVGYVTITNVVIYDETNFRADYPRHLVKKGSKYDIHTGGIKYGYILSDPERCNPIPITSKGIVIRNI